MSGSGARDSGSPPWGPADPVPELADTQALSGLGADERSGRTGPGYPEPDHAGPDHAGPGQADPENPAPGRAGRPGGGKRRRRRSFWLELLALGAIALVLALLIKSFLVQAFFIPTGSMQDTLEINDRVLINKVVYHLRSIDRGDIIVFDGSGSWDFNSPPASSNIFTKAADELEGIIGVSHDSSIYIKRVIGLPGDRVACCDSKGQVTVNGVPLSEGSYLYPGDKPSAQRFSVTVPAGDLWVMGDHRSVSWDSRGHTGDPGGGAIPESAVLGRAFVVIWPPSRWGFLNIPATFEQPRLHAPAAAGGNAAAGGSSAALEAALDNGTPVQATASALPLALGFAGALPLTWLQRRIRTRRRRNRDRE